VSTRTRAWLSGFCSAGPYDRYPDSHKECDKHPRYEKPCACTCHWRPETGAASEERADAHASNDLAALECPCLPGAPKHECGKGGYFQVTAPCVIDDLNEAVYHAPWTVPKELGGSLSNSGAKVLYSKTPAHFQHEREHGRANKRAFDVGHAVHERVLGVGAETVRIDADSYRTNAAREARDAAYAAGKVPLLADEVDEVGLMAEAVLKHRTARVLFEADAVIEQSLFWQDTFTGMYLRCRPDSRVTLGSGRVCAVDLKSTTDADPDTFGKTADNFGYVQQDPFYMAGLGAHGLVDADSTFLFVNVEKDAPYLVSVVELDDEARRIGRARNRRAIDLFASCTEAGEWPGYSPKVEPVSLPYWTIRKHEEENEE